MTESKPAKKKIGVSRVVEMPNGVTATLHHHTLTVKGPKGEVSKLFKAGNLSMKLEGNKFTVEAQRATRNNKKFAGSINAHVNNMIRGSQEKHEYKMKICSGHFPMNVSVTSGKLVVKNFLGEKVPRTLLLKHGADVKVEGDHINISSASKETAGQVAADIEQLTRRPGFDTRIFQDGIYIIMKDGKDLK
jgi:large subunit ribosomal protein L6